MKFLLRIAASIDAMNTAIGHWMAWLILFCTLTSATGNVAAPTATTVLVAGGGEGAARVLVERSAGDLAAAWARRIEAFRDARDTTDVTELGQSGY